MSLALCTLRDQFAAAPLADLHHACLVLAPGEAVHETAFGPFFEAQPWTAGPPVTNSLIRFTDGSAHFGRFFGDPAVYRQFRRLGNAAAAALADVPAAAEFLARLRPPPASSREGFLAWVAYLYEFAAGRSDPRLRSGESMAQVWRNDWDAPDLAADGPEAYPYCRWLESNLYAASAAAIDLLLGPPAEASPANGVAAVRPKKSTARGDARAKLVPALIKHHQYAEGGCLTLEPIGVSQLARAAGVSKSSASDFFNARFGGQEKADGHAKYQVVCRSPARLVEALKVLNGEFSPHDLYGRQPPGEGGRREGDD
jgi:hypothetical protein